MRLTAATAAGLLFALSSIRLPQALPTQSQSQSPAIFRAGIDVVELDVSVLDRDRRVVHGLTADDFEIAEDGRRQQVFSAREVMPDQPTPRPVWADVATSDVSTNDLLDRRLLAIVMDDVGCCAQPPGTVSATKGSDRLAIENAIATANRIVDALGPNDLATVALTHDPVPALPFTNERRLLREVISRFAPLTETIQQGGCVPQRQSTAQQDLRQLLAMSPQPRKAMIVIQPVVPLDTSHLLKCRLPSYVTPDTGKRVVLPPQQSRFKPISEELGNVPVYVLNIGGPILERGDLPQIVVKSVDRSDGPNASGGRNYLRTFDLTSAVADIFTESESYYLVGFRTSRPTVDGKFRRLDVRIKRPGYFWIRSRTGYVRPRNPPRPGSFVDRHPEVSQPPAGAAGLLPASDIFLRASVAAFASQTGSGTTLLATIDASHTVLEPSPSGREEIAVRIVCYASGDARYDISTKVTVPVAVGVTRVSTSIPLRFDVAPGSYTLRVTAHDARTNRLGSLMQDVTAPDFAGNSVAISSIVLGREPSMSVMLPSVLAGIVPVVPGTARAFGNAEEVTAFFQIYRRPGIAGSLELLIRVLDDRGTNRFEKSERLTSEQFGASHTVNYRLPLPLSRLALGQHLMSIEARLGERISSRRDVPFVVSDR